MLPVLRRHRSVPAGWDFFNVGRDLDRLFAGNAGSLAGWSPAVDVQEHENGFAVTAELPGLKAEDVDLKIENGVLSLVGEKKEEKEEGTEGSTRHVIERRYGRFERNFTLPRDVDAEKVTAKFDDGVLTVTVPKAASAKPKKIAIRS
jgi:HSP20 family protein